MKKRIICIALGVSCTLGSSSAVRAAAQEPSTSAAQTEASPEVKRVLATYAEIMQELLAQMAAGGRQTERMTALERRMAEEVKTALPELFEVVRNGDFESANAAAYALRSAPDPQAAVTPLLAGLDRFDGKMANNVCLALMYLCMENPAVEVPVEPLARALQVREWGHQQKASQVIEVLAQRGSVKDPDGTLAAALIPMLASQRVRVFRPAREILPKVTGQSLGNAPELWAKWHAKTYGPPTVDLAAGVYELAQIIRLEMRNRTEIYRIEGTTYATYSALLARLRPDAETARGLGRKFGVVMQVPEDGFPLERLTRLAEAVSSLPPYNLVVSPVSDEFVPFSVALQNLRRFLKPSRRSP